MTTPQVRTSEPNLRRLIDAMAGFHAFPMWMYRGGQFTPGELLEGIILNESSGDPRARRYEPHQDQAGRSDSASDPDVPAKDDGDFEDDASYGLMQVMGYNARHLLGLAPISTQSFAFLYDPVININLGCLIFAAELRAVSRSEVPPPIVPINFGGSVERALCRYNGGPSGDALVDVPGNRKDFRLRAYVDRIADHAMVAKADRHNRGWV